MNNLTFKKKLIIFALLIGILPIVILALITYNTASNSLQESIYRGNDVFLVNSISKIEDYFIERKGDANVLSKTADIADALLIKGDLDIQHGNEFLKTVKETYGYSSLYVTDTTGKVVIADDKSLIGVNLSSKDYLSRAFSGELTWSELMYSAEINSNVMILSGPVISKGKIIGAIGIVISQETINMLIHDGVKTLGESGDAYIVNADKLLYSETMLGDYAKNASLKSSVNSEGTLMIADAIKNNNTTFINVGTYLDYLDNPVLGAVGVTKLGDEYVGLIIEVDVSEAMIPVKKIRNITIIILLITVLLIIVVSIILINSILKPIKSVNAMLKDISEGEGDLTKRIHIKTNDEFGELGELFNNFIIKLQNLIGGIAGNAVTLASSSLEISSSIDNSNESLESINSRIADINIGTTNNASVLEETNASLEEIASSANLIYEKSDEASQLSNNALKATQIGSSNLIIASNSVLNVQKSSIEMESVIKSLSDSSNEIGGIINIITGISEQTNLLALNAAIEAARAGEQGKGFAVVADEVRKLAAETKLSAENVTTLVGTLISESNRALKSVENEKKQVVESVENINKTSDEFERILEKISLVTELMGNISSMVSVQTEVTDDIAKAVSEITISTVESASSINHITENIQSQAAIFKEISTSVEELSDTAEMLKSETDKFIVV